MQAMSFDEFARQLRTVFDTLAKRGEGVFVESVLPQGNRFHGYPFKNSRVEIFGTGS